LLPRATQEAQRTLLRRHPSPAEVVVLDRSLYGSDDSEYHVGDDEHDYDDGGVLDEDGGSNCAVAAAPVSRSNMSLLASS
jgi:hypothetical protein